LRRGREASLRVNPEPLGFARGLEFVERQVRAFRPGSRRVDLNSLQNEQGHRKRWSQGPLASNIREDDDWGDGWVEMRGIDAKKC